MAIQINGTTVIDNSRNYTNMAAGNFSGSVTASSLVGDGNNLTNLPASAGTVQWDTTFLGSSFGGGTVGTASITPTSSSNKVLVIYSAILTRNNGGNRGGGAYLYLQRPSGTTLDTNSISWDQNGGNDSSNWKSVSGTRVFLDSPATTSAVTYTFNFSGNNCTNPVVHLIEIKP
jgi:hypothetical protein